MPLLAVSAGATAQNDVIEPIFDVETDTRLREAAPVVSLLTARAGAEIYQLEGHSALRIRDPFRGDYVINWGLFDFAAPNFVYRFVKGRPIIWRARETRSASLKSIAARAGRWWSRCLTSLRVRR